MVGRLTVANIPERGVFRSREPFKFWWALGTYHISGMAEAIYRVVRIVKFCMHVGYVKSQHTDDKSPLNGASSASTTLNVGSPMTSLERLKLESSYFAWR